MALFENFPYTNIHELNLDWIVKIAKDFLEQYTHIQQLISDGETSLTNLTETGLASLQEKADALEAALQAWYDTHSEDIAQELADALADLNSWYEEHQEFLNQYVIDTLAQFEIDANTRAQHAIETIPSDYTALYNRVNRIDNALNYDQLPALLNGVSLTGTPVNLPSIETRDMFIAVGGTVQSSESFAYTSPISLKKGQTAALYAKGYQNRIAMISLYVDGTNYTPVALSIDGTVRLYTYTATEDCDVVFSYDYGINHAALISNPHIDAISEYLYDDVSFDNVIWGAYIGTSGGIGTGANDFRYTHPFTLKAGMTIVFNAAGSGTAVAMIAKYNGEGMNYTPLVICLDGTVREYRYHTDEDIMIALSYDTTKTHTAYYYLDTVIPNAIDYSVLFPRMSVIGDSLSSGCLHIDGSDTDYYGDSWLSFMARRCNVQRNHYSRGGLTCLSWIQNYMTKMQSDPASNIYFIALGTNDGWFQPYEMGTAADEAGSNTFAGYYKQIINAVRAKAPNAVICCLSLYKANTTFNPLIQAITRQYANVFYIDIPSNSEIDPDTGGVWSNGSHFTTLGYNYIANVIYKQLNQIVALNMNTFKFFGRYNSIGAQYDF